MVSLLVGSVEKFRITFDHVIFQFTHGVEFHACLLLEGFACSAQRIFRRGFHRLTLLVEESGEHRHCRNLREWVDEGCRETRNYIKVGIAGFDKGEEA